MIALVLALSLAWAEPGARVDLAGTFGMRAGGLVGAVARPWRGFEAGAWMGVATDLYAFAPDTITWGLDPVVNLRVSPTVAVGWVAGVGRRRRVELGGHLLAGIEVSSLREQKEIPALGVPVDWSGGGVAPHGGVLGVGRFWLSDRVGLGTQLLVPLPPSATGSLHFERMFVGLGLAVRSCRPWGPAPGGGRSGPC